MEQFAEWLVEFIRTVGYPGVFIGMFLGNVLVPIPVEVVMIPAGFLVEQGHMHLGILMLFGIAGDVSGSLFSYYIAKHFGRRVLLAYGKYLFLNEKKLALLDTFFANHGEISILTGRLTPGLRHFMAFPAGLSHMPVKKFAFYTAIGGAIWMGILVEIGSIIGDNKELVKEDLSYITAFTMLLLAIAIALYVRRHRKKHSQEPENHA